MTVIIIVLVVIVLLVAIGAGMYNGLVRLNQQASEAWSDITVQLKRRYDLIPNLVNTVKGYAAHESKVFEEVIAARTQAMNATGIAQKAETENALAGTLKSLFAVSEAYPDLKANQGFQQLQAEITDTEDKIQASRRFYNGRVRDYNIKLQVFPTNMLAGMLGFTHRDFFGVDNQAEIEKPAAVNF